MRRRLMMLLVGAAMAAASLGIAGAAGAQEAPGSPVLNETPDDTWMTNGKIFAVVRSGDYVYVGGKFTRARESTAKGAPSFAATNVARFHADTGVGDPTWTPDVTGADTSTTVYALAATGGNIWVGGKFQAVDGVARRNLAAVSESTGVVNPDIDPLVGSETNNGVRAIVASGTKVYLGGYFGSIDGNGRRFLGAVSASTGNLDGTWRPKVDGLVRSLSFSCDGMAVFAGGKFRNAAGAGSNVYSPRETIARFDATTGALDPWAIPAGTVPNDQIASDLAVTCGRITAGYLGQNWARSFRLDNGDTGTMVWEDKTAGNVQAVTMLGADKVVIGGHFSNVTEDARVVSGAKRYPRSRIALLNLSDGSVDQSWAPEFDGNFFGPWDLLVEGNHLWVGGQFQTVEGLPKTHLARFTFS